jgi:transposase
MQRDMSVVGIDIAKRVFHVIGMDKQGKIIVRKRFYRGEVMSFLAQLLQTTVGMEACGSAHYGARQWRQQGHQVTLMAPPYVKPSVKSNTNDMRVRKPSPKR